MEFECNKHYSKEFLDEAAIWWQDHKDHDINEYADYFEIVYTGAIQWKIDEAQDYLRQTDYIICKLTEAIAEDDSEQFSYLKQKYSVELAKRKEMRRIINETEQELARREAAENSEN